SPYLGRYAQNRAVYEPSATRGDAGAKDGADGRGRQSGRVRRDLHRNQAAKGEERSRLRAQARNRFRGRAWRQGSLPPRQQRLSGGEHIGKKAHQINRVSGERPNAFFL